MNRDCEVVSSILFLQRKKIKKQIYFGYFSFMLIFAGSLFYNSNSIDLFGSVAHLLVFLGLYIGLFTLFEISTVIEIVQKNQNPYFLRPSHGRQPSENPTMHRLTPHNASLTWGA